MASLSIIIPCFDEELTIGDLIRRISALLPDLQPSYTVEVVCVDDGSRDRTMQVVSELAKDLPWLRLVQHSANRGLGQAMQTGVTACRGDLIAMLDADGTFPPEALPALLAKLDQGYDIVIGSAFHPQGRIVRVNPFRLLLSRCLSWTYRMLSHVDLYSFSGIFRVYRRQVFAAVTVQPTGFCAVSDILLQALAQGFRVAEVPTTLSSRQHGQSKLHLWAEVRGHLHLLRRTFRLRFSPARRTSRPEHGTAPEVTRATGDVFNYILGLEEGDYQRQSDLLLYRLQRPAELFRGATCLDAGCGRGEVAHALAALGAAAVVGLDAGLHIFRTRQLVTSAHERFVRGTVLELPFPDASFHVVHCSGVLHHTADPERAFRELVRVLRPGGLLYVAVVGREGLQLVVTLLMRWLAKRIPLTAMGSRLKRLPDWVVTGLLDVGYAPIRLTFTERDLRRWFEQCDLHSLQRTRSERYDYRGLLSRLWWGVGWIQLSGFKPEQR